MGIAFGGGGASQRWWPTRYLRRVLHPILKAKRGGSVPTHGKQDKLSCSTSDAGFGALIVSSPYSSLLAIPRRPHLTVPLLLPLTFEFLLCLTVSHLLGSCPYPSCC